jgi:hypothetical protein
VLGINGISCQSQRGVFLRPQEVARPLIAERHGHAGTGRELEAAMQEILAEILLARPAWPQSPIDRSLTLIAPAFPESIV